MATETEKLYVIKWRSELTGATGGGTTGYSREHAQSLADSENDFYREDRIKHWIEPMETGE